MHVPREVEPPATDRPTHLIGQTPRGPRVRPRASPRAALTARWIRPARRTAPRAGGAARPDPPPRAMPPAAYPETSGQVAVVLRPGSNNAFDRLPPPNAQLPQPTVYIPSIIDQRKHSILKTSPASENRSVGHASAMRPHHDAAKEGKATCVISTH